MAAPRDEGLTEILAGLPEQSPLGIVLLDTDLRILWVNPTLTDLSGVPGELWRGQRLSRMLPGLEVDRVEPMLRHVLASGERVVDVQRHGPLLSDPESARRRVWSCSGFRLEGDGGVIGVALITSDVTRRSQEQERLALLNEASERIGSTLDVTRTVEETLDVLVPRVGDCAVFNLLSYVLDGGQVPRLQQGDSVRLLIAATRWLPGQPVPEALRTGSVSYLDPSRLYYRLLSTGRTIFVPRLAEPPAEFGELTRSETFRRRLRTVMDSGVHSGMIVPVAARGVILGTVVLLRVREPAFADQEVSLAQDVLARSAICVDNARVYSRERATALELQRSMLPQSIMRIPGVELAYRYEPANTAAEIGGDWFDVLRQPDGRVVLIIGDVTGHDIHAASLMGQLRTVTRTLATLDLSPVEVLARLDAVVADMGDDTGNEVGATCVYVVFDPVTRRCVIARAGHPPPALVRPGAGVEFLDLPAGLPLGVGGAAFGSVELDLGPGCVLVLYTDGLIETPDADIDVGMGRLAQALADRSAEPFAPDFASTLINRLVADPADDIAVLVARIAEHEA